jgi:hypothetical protein
MLSYLGFGSTEQKDAGREGPKSEFISEKPEENIHAMPMNALDSLKHAGVPLRVQMTPYLQVNQLIFPLMKKLNSLYS